MSNFSYLIYTGIFIIGKLFLTGFILIGSYQKKNFYNNFYACLFGIAITIQLTIPFYILWNSAMNNKFSSKFIISIDVMMVALQNCLTVVIIISMMAGKTTHMQVLVMVIF